MKKDITMQDIFKDPQYSGKHVILAAGKVYSAKTGRGASKILEDIRKNQPDVTPEIAYIVPKGRTLII